MIRKIFIGLSFCLSFLFGVLNTMSFIHWKNSTENKTKNISSLTTKSKAFRKYIEGGMNSPSRPISELAYNVINNGSKEDYDELMIYGLDIGYYKLLSFSLLVANKYDYEYAYINVYNSLFFLNQNIKCKINISDDEYSLDNLDAKTQKMAVEYLRMAANKGNTQAKEILSFYKKEGKYLYK